MKLGPTIPVLGASILSLVIGCERGERGGAGESAIARAGTPHCVVEGTGIVTMVAGSAIQHPRLFSRRLRNHLELVFVNMDVFEPAAGDDDEENRFAIRRAVDRIEEARKALGIERMVIAGHSMFAVVALEYAKAHPGNVSHLVMIAIAPRFDDVYYAARSDYWEARASHERKRLLERRREELAERPLEGANEREALVLRNLAEGPKRWYDAGFDASWLWDGVEIDMEASRRLADGFREYDIADNLDRVTMPVFLALGLHDYNNPHYLWDEYAPRMPTLELHLFEKSAHFPMFEEQELFDERLLEFLGAVGGE